MKGLIMVIAFEELLNARSLELRLMLHHLLRVSILPLAVSVLGIKVIFGLRGYERSGHTLLDEGLPVETGEPLVLFEDLGSLLSKAVTRLALDKPVNEVCSLDRPSTLYLVLVDFDLFGQDMVTDLLSVFTVVGAFSKHALVGNDAHSEIVNGHSMVLAAHDFGCHVAWGA
jgi:hypothetical protein